MEKYPYFPFFIDISHWKILVVGGGTIGGRRMGVLRRFGAAVHAVCPTLGQEAMELYRQGEIHWEARAFTMDDLKAQDWNLVLAATDDETLNSSLVEACRSKKIPVNNASCQQECDFFFPAIIQEGGMVMGLVSDGSCHGAVRKTAARLRTFMKEEINNRE